MNTATNRRASSEQLLAAGSICSFSSFFLSRTQLLPPSPLLTVSSISIAVIHNCSSCKGGPGPFFCTLNYFGPIESALPTGLRAPFLRKPAAQAAVRAFFSMSSTDAVSSEEYEYVLSLLSYSRAFMIVRLGFFPVALKWQRLTMYLCGVVTSRSLQITPSATICWRVPSPA